MAILESIAISMNARSIEYLERIISISKVLVELERLGPVLKRLERFDISSLSLSKCDISLLRLFVMSYFIEFS